ncbi:MAG TPA: phospholipase D-like domain-containing protein [Woeseiaceae bacterium]|nr:phospholipase D-like domain-containing protein [Woeseiaceae bacterium]
MPVVIAVIGTAFAIVIAIILLKRRGTPKFDIAVADDQDVAALLPALAGLTGGVVFRGNEVTVLQDAAIFTAMLRDIDAAEHSVHFETFVWTDGELAERVAGHLIAAQRRGVRVRLLLDAVGASRADRERLERVKDAGIELGFYRKLRPWNLFHMNHRTHRKLLIIDGRIGYCFGHGVADQWLKASKGEPCWRDTGVRIEGAAVAGLQQVFFQNWMETTLCAPLEPDTFPVPAEPGEVDVHVISSSPEDYHSNVGLIFALILAAAKEEVLIQNPYFVPEPDFIDSLASAVRRGVRVRMILPGAGTDSPFVALAGRHLYPALLAAGVELWEYQPTLCHQKIVVADKRWCHVGSTNLDARSLELNAEVSVGIDCPDTARELEAAFEKDLLDSRRIDTGVLARVPWYERLGAACAYRFHGQL